MEEGEQVEGCEKVGEGGRRWEKMGAGGRRWEKVGEGRRRWEKVGEGGEGGRRCGEITRTFVADNIFPHHPRDVDVQVGVGAVRRACHQGK